MSLKKIIILFVIVIPLFLLESCSETPTNVGSGLLEQDQIDVLNIDSSVDSIVVTSSFLKRALPLGTSTRLMLGKKGNVEAGILIRYLFNLHDTLASQILHDSIFVLEAWMEFQQDYLFGKSTDPLDLKVYKVNSGWTTVGFTADSISSLQYDNADKSIGYNVSDTLTKIKLDPQLALTWLKSAADSMTDYGAYIKPEPNSGKIVGYYALGSFETLIPRLSVVYRKLDNNIDTLMYTAFADLGYVEGELPQVSSTNIAVQSGLEVISKLNFDISGVPSNAIINKAELVLSVDSSETITGDNFTNSLLAYFTKDSVNIDSLTSSVILYPAGNTFAGDITFYVQEWVRSGNNSGLVIKSTGRYSGVEIFALKGSNADAAVRPRIIITYTVKK